MKMKLFQYVILLHPGEKKKDQPAEKTKLLKEPEYLLSVDEKQAAMLVARQIPEEHLDKLERIEVIVRPF